MRAFVARTGRAGWLAWSLVGTLLILAGCSAAPTPLVARAGTTIGIAISGDSEILAFGTSMHPDPQRGALIFELRDASDVLIATLPVRVITKVVADPASDAGLSPDFPLEGGSIRAVQQVLALLDIPSSVPAGQYHIIANLAADASGAPPVTAGPSDSSMWNIEILAPAVPGDTDFATWDAEFFGLPTVISPDQIKHIIPNPKLVLRMPSSATAAAMLELLVPARIQVKGAILNNLNGDRALVTIEQPEPGRVKIHYLNTDPTNAFIPQIALVFALTATPPVTTSDFTYLSGSFYDSSGGTVTPAPSYQPLVALR